jgi:hypothetical protein
VAVGVIRPSKRASGLNGSHDFEHAKLFGMSEGPAAVVRFCRFCKHVEVVRKGLRGAGRGYGMREGNKARGRMIQHLKACPGAQAAYAAWLAERKAKAAA